MQILVKATNFQNVAGAERKAIPLINALLATKIVPSVVTKDTFKLSAIVVTEAIEVNPDQEDVVVLHK